LEGVGAFVLPSGTEGKLTGDRKREREASRGLKREKGQSVCLTLTFGEYPCSCENRLNAVAGWKWSSCDRENLFRYLKGKSAGGWPYGVETDLSRFAPSRMIG
jgi:hypothetical protein